ncbi:hypothetical protein GNX18_06950 [Microbulbifer sp. SH-1]|uniref:hypothetical protein n=1 Tax=Microbulbifer sp. SH-1 TaxID=2681547 RepID=UPI00140B646F|nr:hypothetical protein [Microbulbifer sp. SH-1]QIL89520.1 hypothetical protein GNX18_06950 [Microbulbifer sp. SH-1]
MFRYVGTKSSLTWDGNDSGITEENYPYACIECGKQSQYQVKDLKKIKTVLNDRMIGFLIEKKLVSQSSNQYFIKAGIPAYVVSCECPGCGIRQHILIGLKEVQPQRYNIYKKSIIVDE